MMFFGPYADPRFSNIFSDVVEGFEKSWKDLENYIQIQIKKDIFQLMIGNTTITGQSLIDLVKSGTFIKSESNLRIILGDIMKAWFSAVSINLLWYVRAISHGCYITESKFKQYHRSTAHVYIVKTLADNSSCAENSRERLALQICLPEDPAHAYYIYSIDESKQQVVKAPPGFEQLTRKEGYAGVKIEDVIRSSLYVHEHNLEGPIRDINFTQLAEFPNTIHSNTTHSHNNITNIIYPNSTHPNTTHYGEHSHEQAKCHQHPKISLGQVPAAFRVPVCNNPYGEAVAINDTKAGAFYPCMCGNFLWDSSPSLWSMDRDETGDFLKYSGLYAMPKFEYVCGSFVKCKITDQYSWKDILNITKDELPLASKLQHPFQTCKRGMDRPLNTTYCELAQQ